MTEPLPEPRAVPPSGPALPASPEPSTEPVARARRSRDQELVAGVAQGVAEHLGWSPLLVRGGFVLLALMQGLGIFLYGLLWVLMPQQEEQESQAPGLESAERRGMRRREKAGLAVPRDGGALLALALLGAGTTILALNFGVGPNAAVFWPLAFAAAGLALVWRQADAPAVDDEQAPRGLLGRFLSGRGWAAVVRMTAGMGLVGVSVSMVAASQIGVTQLPLMLALAALMVLGVGIAAAPWITRMRRNAQAAHERALLDQARADMAAHLHDSVLQTLALIQRQSEDSRAVAALARRQERELRQWLYGDEPIEGSLRTALARAAQEIEDERGVDVELVCVGDRELDGQLDALVRAAREAMMNAAKHSGADRVDVFCEVEDHLVELFVRDRGVGFRMEEIGDDRMGVTRSILQRMERHGGTARIRSEPGEGTEVRLAMEI
ncbi:PspC domain-containing protein [Luteococcus peritonei]|uniref:PspC domain-containing protein n=1 Tax=Luteococcus peritonei TaxID=88874 RepID=A0ABW4RWJ5_9ACTN